MFRTVEAGPEIVRPILPDYAVASVLDVNFERLCREGKSHILVDLDLTLRTTQFAESPEPDLVAYLLAEKAAGRIDSITLASNSLHDLTSFAQALEADCQQPFEKDGKTICKPDPRFYQAILDKKGIAADEAVMIGDRYELDVVGASRAGITTVLVEPLAVDYPFDLLERTRRRDRRALSIAKAAFMDAEITAHLGDDPSPKALEIARLLPGRLDKAKPYLFSLADQILDAYPDYKWDSMLVDDTGGRFVGRFMRHILQRQGICMPTAFVCGSASVRHQLPPEAYKAWAERIANSPCKPRHPLLISESSGTGSTLQHIDALMGPHFNEIDHAVVAAQFPDAVEVDGLFFYGGHGKKAVKAITAAFEMVEHHSPRDRLEAFFTTRLPYFLYDAARRHFEKASYTPEVRIANIDVPNFEGKDTDGVLPLAIRTQDERFKGVTKYCSTLITRLAAEYTDNIVDLSPGNYPPLTLHPEE